MPDHALDPIDQLLTHCLARPEAEWAAAITAQCAAQPQHADELRRRFAQVQQMTLSAPAAPEAVPERLGEFRILRRLGGGGMGVVYLAEQEPLGRAVALKLIRPDQLYFPGARDRFRREVDAVARLSHPGIVPILTVGEADGIPYFAMEHVPGASLDAVLERVPRKPAARLTAADFATALAAACPGAELSAKAASWPDQCAELVLQVAEALEHAHTRGVLHRDVKPSNVMVTPTGQCRLLDFGLAVAPGASRLTRTGTQMGSLPFMAPEQVAGRFDQVDRRSDVYSLGVTLYELYTLRLPFHAETNSALMRAISEVDAQDPRQLNPSLSTDQAAVVLKALEKEPARRYQTAFDFAQDLRALIEGRPVSARPIGRIERAGRWARREPALAALLGLLVCAVPATAAVVGYTMATHEAAEVGRRKQLADRIESTLARGFLESIHGRSKTTAQRTFREVLALAPGNMDAMLGLGKVVLRTEGPAGLLSFLDGEARGLAGRAAFVRLRAMALSELGRVDEALELRRVEPAPEGVAELLLLTEVAVEEVWQTGDDTAEREALALAGEVILRSPQARFLPYARQAQLAARTGDERLARRTVAAMAELWPDQPLLDFVRGNTLNRFAPREGAEALRRYLAQYPDASAMVNLSLALSACREEQEALQWAERAVAADPELFQAQLRLGTVRCDLGQTAAGVPHLVKALHLRPPHFDSSVRLVGVLQQSPPGTFAEAEAALLQAALDHPRSFVLQGNVGAWLGSVGRIKEALPFLRRAVELQPGSVQARASLGAALQQTGDTEAAIAELEQAIRLDPRHFEARYNLGVALARIKDHAAAAEAYRAALLIQDDASARNNLGLMLLAVGTREQAVAEFRRALLLDPVLRPAHNNLMRQLERLGDEDGMAAEEARWAAATSRPASRK